MFVYVVVMENVFNVAEESCYGFVGIAATYEEAEEIMEDYIKENNYTELVADGDMEFMILKEKLSNARKPR